ncbi:MAG: MATE family efflux transporter [Clostridiales bacterium]|nr:MATE family efflux transporter [Clostridiales bacterium]
MFSINKPLTQEERFQKLTTEPVPHLVLSLAPPTIITQLITTLYNMADTYFVSQLGTSASAAVGIVLSLMGIIQTIGYTFGTGSGVCISKFMGEKKRDIAGRYASTAFAFAFGIGVLLMVFGLIFLDPLVRLMGATDTILPYAREYTRYILIGAPYMVCTFVLNVQMRNQGNAFFSMLGVASGCIINLFLDPLFIFTFRLGIRGAAMATILSQFISFSLLFFYTQAKSVNLTLRLRDVRPTKKMMREILMNGFPSFCRQGINSLSAVAMNRCAGPFGDAAIAALGITQRVVSFITSVLIGFGQASQPVFGFNYGAKNYQRIKETYRFCMQLAVGILLGTGVLLLIFAPQVITMFRREDMEVISIGTRAMRCQALLMPVESVAIIGSMLMQLTHKPIRAAVVSMSRKGLFFIPCMIIMPYLWGLDGLVWAQPVADIFTFLLTIPLTVSVMRELKRELT